MKAHNKIKPTDLPENSGETMKKISPSTVRQDKKRPNNPAVAKNNANPLKLQEIRKRIKSLLLTSSAIGVNKLMHANNLYMKIMWLLFFLGSMCAGGYLTIDSIFDYLQHKTVTAVKIINDLKPQFPTISFCANPPFNSSLDQIIQSVAFEKVEFNLSKNFEEFHDPVYGKCFRFNSGKNLHEQKTDLN